MSDRRLSQVYGKLMSWWHTVLGTGVRPGMSFIEARRTRLLNLIALPTIPFMTYFACLNFTQERYVLATVNLLTLGGNLATFILHKAHRYLSARLFIILYSIVLYTFAGVYFQNGAEFFLLNILIVTLLVYDKPWVRWTISMLIITCFLIIHFLPQEAAFARDVPAQRHWANVGMALIFIPLALSYFKQLHTDYQQITENQRKALAAMNRDKEKMFSIVAHDIRSPLATLEGLLEMFNVGEYTEQEMREAASILHKKIGPLSSTLDNLLRWSIGQMKGIRTRPEEFLVSPLLQEVLDLLEPALKQKDLRISNQVTTDSVLYADSDQTAVILRNLISNALKFSHPGGTIYLSSYQDGSRQFIEVRDEGVGMSVEQMANIFSIRAEPAYGTRGERGTGLGLMLCREFAEQNGGNLVVKSIEGEGTSFLLEMPAEEEEDEMVYFE
ncbi:HAMP domain-containing histidine kinase [Chitinophaga sedimenti]|uniref:sensor histidine kinase n=1 Tax=Chitinophaga sedimenti TaxID=2033606 RepID=UPI002004599F|nr:HAMP domain-containing sensor histidine kinase [Chitinophaga sedimenti]MCK7553930.1 HAMP domain-containing histidine kinase [Chitinophaga sedimenti]